MERLGITAARSGNFRSDRSRGWLGWTGPHSLATSPLISSLKKLLMESIIETKGGYYPAVLHRFAPWQWADSAV
jgi:hypothetical protein